MSRLTLSRAKRRRTSGFRKRMSTRPGQRIINRKRRKGRSVNIKNRL